MLNKFINFIYNFDIIGPCPKLYVFKKERYQNILSLILSIIIILVSLIFILYSVINYVQNDRPTVVYSKNNDINEERIIYVKDMLVMFQIMDKSLKKLNESFAHFESVYTAIYDNAKIDYSFLDVKKCKPGENLNIKYEKMLKEKFNELSQQQVQEDKNLEDFYCISSEDPSISLFHYPNIGYSFIDLNIILHNQSLYKPEDLSLMIIYENNLINHDNKKSPISEGISYQFLQFFSSDEYYKANINFQYLKYETDDGLFFDSWNYLKGMSFLDMNYYKDNQENYDLNKNFIENNLSKIGTISFVLNKSNYDLYRRTYKKLQALLAEIMSIVSLLFEVGTQILAFINEKKMNIDIIRKIFNVENEKRKNQLNNNDKIKITADTLNKSFKLSEKNSICIQPTETIDKELENKTEKILNTINIFNILKSFICCGKKDQLISLCNDIIQKDMSVEIILERFYRLGNIYNQFDNKESNDNLSFNLEERFRKVYLITDDIINNIKGVNSKNDNKSNI